MTDHDDRTEARIRAAFSTELRRAEGDLELSPLRIGPWQEGRSSAAGLEPRRRHPVSRPGVLIATAALVVCVAVGASFFAGGLRNAAVPQTASPSAASTQTASTQATSSIPRYSDGIPKVWQGQPVLRWNDALAERLTATDATPFLVGVWLDVLNGPHSCPAGRADPGAPDSWATNSCPDRWISPDQGGAPAELDGIATFHFTAWVLWTGPAILRVHVHDPNASQCGYQQAICGSMIVVENAVWTGDSFTDPRPFTVDDVIAAAAAVDPKTTLTLMDSTSPTYDLRLPGAIALSPGNVMPADMQVHGAYLMSSTQAMQRALPDVQPGAAGTVLPSAYRLGESGSGPYYSFSVADRWLVVDNVAFSVLTLPEPSAADRAWLASLEAALRATH